MAAAWLIVGASLVVDPALLGPEVENRDDAHDQEQDLRRGAGQAHFEVAEAVLEDEVDQRYGGVPGLARVGRDVDQVEDLEGADQGEDPSKEDGRRQKR